MNKHRIKELDNRKPISRQNTQSEHYSVTTIVRQLYTGPLYFVLSWQSMFLNYMNSCILNNTISIAMRFLCRICKLAQ